MHLRMLLAVAPMGFCIVFFLISHKVNKTADQERDAANSLVVLSGLLAALAILVPLGATLMPGAKEFGLTAWLLVGALLSGATCLFGTVYCMIEVQQVRVFKPQDKRYVPGWTNATWIALGALALATILIKIFPYTGQTEPDSQKGTLVRFAVARNLPALGSSQEMIQAAWGTPTLAKTHELRYQTANGTVVFCLDPKGLVRSIRETQEVDLDAVGTLCGEN